LGESILHYEGNIIRPPSEANSILLQITVGCSRNKCTFCGAYKGERFRIKPDSIIMEDIAYGTFQGAFPCKSRVKLPSHQGTPAKRQSHDAESYWRGAIR